MDGQNSKNQTREGYVRTYISKEEAIRQIKEVYQAEYDPNCGLDGCFDAWDQLLACEAVEEATPVKDNYYQEKQEIGVNEDSGVNGSVNDSYKRKVNFVLNESKLEAISKLKTFNYKTFPLEIEKCLNDIFIDFLAKEGWWLTVGQQWCPRQINWVLDCVLKLQKTGRITKHPAAAFTYFIQHRKRRKR